MAAALPLRLPAPGPDREVRRWPRFAVGLAAVLVLASLLPYLLAYLWTPPGHHFAGFFFIADDATTYLAKMRQGAEGSWLWTDPYSSEPHAGVFLFGFYLLFGHVAGILHLPLIAAYHLAAASGAIALVLAADRLTRRVLDAHLRRTALVLIIFGSGAGVLAQASGNPAIFGSRVEALDLHLPELTGWYSILAIPHFAWATALIISALVGLLTIAERPAVRTVVLTALALIALTAIHPQMIPVLAIIWAASLVLMAAWRRPLSWRVLLAQITPFLATTPLLAYNAWILFGDPTIAEWARQWRHQAPGPISLALSLGLPGVLAALGIWIAWRRRDHRLSLLAVWPLLVVALLYLPNLANIQRRLLDAIYVPIGILAALGLHQLTSRMPRAGARRLHALALAASCVSSLIVLAIALRFASGAFSEAYVNDDSWQAMQWLSAHHQANDRALSSPQAGLLLPARAGVSVYVGHYSETLNYFDKIEKVAAILKPDAPAGALETFMRQNRLSLLYWGDDERATGFRPEDHSDLRRLYQHGNVTIYRLTGP
jgi:hypothetical protein